MPLSPGRAERHGFEYFRHGTLSLYAALKTATGQVLAKTANRHTSAQFVEFLSEVVATQPAKTLGGVFTHLKGLIQMEGVFSRPREYVHVANGVIELNGAAPKLVGFDPKYYSRNLIPIEYNSRAKCPKFIKKLLKPLPEKDRLVLQKLFGMFVSGTNFLQKILILQGAPGSGKSVLAAVARLLIGAANCEELRTACR